jgi:hypothetical protein
LGPDSIRDKNDPISDEEQSKFHSCTEFEDDLTNMEIKKEDARPIPHDIVNESQRKEDPEGIKIESIKVEINEIGTSSSKRSKSIHHDGRDPTIGGSN